MEIHQTPKEIIVHTPAKLNLFLEVIGKRDDGYHEIESLLCPITIFDTVRFSENPDGKIDFRLHQSLGPSVGKDAQSAIIPGDNRNITVRAVELLRQQAGNRAGAKLGLIKRIPSAAGLGGGSSDAAAALAAANIAWELNWPNNKLARLAATLGSDIPFFLAGGPAICRGRGEQVEQVDAPGVLYFVVVKPPAGLSTEAVYRVCRPAERPQSVLPLVNALKQGHKDQAGQMLFNRLQAAASTLCVWIDRLKEEFERLDCLGHAMTGSGSSYFGICRHARHARRIARRLQLLNIGSVYAVRSCR